MNSTATQAPTLGRMLFLAFLSVPIESVILLAFIAGMATELSPTASGILLFGWLLHLMMAMIRIHFHQHETDQMREALITQQLVNDALRGEVRVWDSQRELMYISGQDTPGAPIITKGSCLYGALILEEVGETMKALGTAIQDVTSESDTPAFQDLGEFYWSAGRRLMHEAEQIRNILKHTDEVLPIRVIRRELAKELLDGFTDIHVVAAGGSLSCGLPGEAAYAETINSNLSKANPDTGLIDKTPDGKWIKGSDYRAPNLDRLLDQFYASDDRASV